MLKELINSQYSRGFRDGLLRSHFRPGLIWGYDLGMYIKGYLRGLGKTEFETK